MLRIRKISIAEVDPEDVYLVLRGQMMHPDGKSAIPLDMPVVLEESDLTGEWFPVPIYRSREN